MGDLTKHFSRREFACKDGCGYGQPHPRLVNALENLRERANGKPLVIVSGIRCPVRNRTVNGAPRSRHQSGEAVDIPAGYVKRAQALAAGFMGIGERDGWVVHVDVRVSRQAVIWQY